jgi:hypothetical protein
MNCQKENIFLLVDRKNVARVLSETFFYFLYELSKRKYIPVGG